MCIRDRCGNYMLSSTLLQYASASSVNDCRGVRYAYLAKGLDLKDVPRQPRQGKGLLITSNLSYCMYIDIISFHDNERIN